MKNNINANADKIGGTFIWWDTVKASYALCSMRNHLRLKQRNFRFMVNSSSQNSGASGTRVQIMKEDIKERLRNFIESEGKSCSFDPELITPLYIYRMWGGKVPLEEIESTMQEMAACGLNEV